MTQDFKEKKLKEFERRFAKVKRIHTSSGFDIVNTLETETMLAFLSESIDQAFKEYEEMILTGKEIGKTENDQDKEL